MAKAVVLYVEDEEFDALFMRRAFEKAGLDASLEVVPDGQHAIHYLSSASGTDPACSLPVVVLLDLNLPVISGFEVLEWIRTREELKSLPVIVFSSSARVEDRLHASRLGADAYLQKPGSGLDFARVVEQLRQQWLPKPANDGSASL